jgi:hypothetical protein
MSLEVLSAAESSSVVPKGSVAVWESLEARETMVMSMSSLERPLEADPVIRMSFLGSVPDMRGSRWACTPSSVARAEPTARFGLFVPCHSPRGSPEIKSDSSAGGGGKGLSDDALRTLVSGHTPRLPLEADLRGGRRSLPHRRWCNGPTVHRLGCAAAGQRRLQIR